MYYDVSDEYVRIRKPLIEPPPVYDEYDDKMKTPYQLAVDLFVDYVYTLLFQEGIVSSKDDVKKGLQVVNAQTLDPLSMRVNNLYHGDLLTNLRILATPNFVYIPFTASTDLDGFVVKNSAM